MRIGIKPGFSKQLLRSFFSNVKYITVVAFAIFRKLYGVVIFTPL